MEDKQSRERERVRQIAQEYREKGYTVTENPSSDQLPSALRGARWRPDMIAVSDEKRLVIEVASTDELRASSQLVEIAKRLEEEEGWTLVFVLSNPKRKQPDDYQAPETLVSKARSQLSSGEYEYALIIAFAALESAVTRRVKGGKRASVLSLARMATMDGLLSREDFQRVSDAFLIRNTLVHGASSPSPSPDDYIQMAEDVLNAVDRLSNAP